VRCLYEHYQARDWLAAARELAPDARLEMPATGESLNGREAVIGMQERYPEPWGDLAVLRVVADGGTSAVAEVEVVTPREIVRCAAFCQSQVRDGLCLLRYGVDYWVTVGGDEPPPR